MSLLSIEGKIVTSAGVSPGRVEISLSTGLIEHLGSITGQADLVFKEELIFPGFIDLHVHAREDSSHSQDYKEDFFSASKAAINGGVVAFAEMPNNPAPPIDEQSYKAKQKLGEKSLVDTLLYAGIGNSTRPLPFLVPYKVFMGPSVGDLFFKSQKELEEAIKKYEGQYVSFHCEDPEILLQSKNFGTHEAKRPAEAEILAVEFAIELIKKYNLRGKICHASTKESLELITRAKKQDVSVTMEVAPHHLYFDAGRLGHETLSALRVNPPIRQTEENRLALIRALKNGDIDYLATDHAPHTKSEKAKGISGMPHLDTYGPFVTWLMVEHGFTAFEISRVCGLNPGKFLGKFLGFKYGKIEKGCLGSFTVIDPGKPITISSDNLKTKCEWSPFEGVTFPGSVACTIVKGKVYKI
ncbi:MAG: amidohydrolase [Candidatus Doudnabacteria bacterium CG10_big_fil_rev_8_21_14_0_10_42_18]|uniref:Amidohydrolase n=1 Tax=Candidatus Doudnabacteria bacterium CG10_big_fil_rev_8_21_14_0_10_42_18 TaxID=1974552 RepID=A0A2H0VAT5_9BACT|nr:MAG: amidohydrolase [Candidatus Doudnabacteria bacterium CG10_big_fil_rev_8_21_14_0_10_42_18]